MNRKVPPESLQKALKALPSYAAPADLWSAIDQQLELDAQERVLQQQLTHLPAYQPPPSVWLHIDRQLTQDTPRPLWRVLAKYPLRWAAIMLLLFSLTWWMTLRQHSDWLYSQQQEQADSWLLAADWDTDEVAFSEVVRLHQRYLQIFDDHSAAALQEELMELNAARLELKQAMQQYGKDRELIRQLAAIEQARTRVVNQMAQQI